MKPYYCIKYQSMKIKIISSLILVFTVMTVSAQNYEKCIEKLELNNVSLDSIDRIWLENNMLFLRDMTSLVEMDTSGMNRAIIQMSTKLLSNNLTEISSEEVEIQKEFIGRIIYGAFDDHDLAEEKKLSAISWYHMIVNEIRL